MGRPALVALAIAVLALGVRAVPARGEGLTEPCPPTIAGGIELSAGFAGEKGEALELGYGRRVLLRGRVLDPGGNPLNGATVCVDERTLIPGREYSRLGTARTNVDGYWSFKLASGASRALRVSYGEGPGRQTRLLRLRVRAQALLRIGKLVTRDERPIHFSGRIGGPLAGRRVVFLRGTVPGARRKFLVRRALTDAFGRFEMTYAFSPVGAPTKFVFWAVVPAQGDYPYLLGQSRPRFIRVRPSAVG